MMTPAMKRRRAAAASATLARPFRSPTVTGTPTKKAETVATKQGAQAKAQAQAQAQANSLSASPERAHKRPRTARPSLPVQTPPQTQKPLLRRTPRTGPSVPLETVMEQFAAALEAGDETLSQVRASLAAPKPVQRESELPALIVKWRAAGRQAADEVFKIVAERIARAGGYKSWRKMTAPLPSLDDDYGFTRRRDEDEDEYDRDEYDRYEYEDEERREEEESQVRDVRHLPVRHCANHQTFTMATMLASMNVDPDILGYDELEEQWKD